MLICTLQWILVNCQILFGWVKIRSCSSLCEKTQKQICAVNSSLHWSLIDPQQDGKPVGDNFKKTHYVFCVRLPGDSILEQLVHFLKTSVENMFIGERKRERYVRKKYRLVASCMHPAPWTGVKPTAFWWTGWHSNWATWPRLYIFWGEKYNGMVFCKSLRKEQSQHFLLESPFARLCSVLCRWIAQGSFGGDRNRIEVLNAVSTLNKGGFPFLLWGSFALFMHEF